MNRLTLKAYIQTVKVAVAGDKQNPPALLQTSANTVRHYRLYRSADRPIILCNSQQHFTPAFIFVHHNNAITCDILPLHQVHQVTYKHNFVKERNANFRLSFCSSFQSSPFYFFHVFSLISIIIFI